MTAQNQPNAGSNSGQADPKSKPEAKKAGPKVKSASHYKKLGLDPKVYGAK